MPKQKKLHGGQNVSNIYKNFLNKFGANPDMNPQEIQKKFIDNLQSEFESIGNNKEVIKKSLSDYVNVITEVQQSLSNKETQLMAEKNNLNKQKAMEKQYRNLLKQTTNLLNKFDKYLLKYMSFVRTNPRSKILLSNLAEQMENISLDNEYNQPVVNANYRESVANKANKIQNTIMIKIIQAIIENTRPIYQDLQSVKQKLDTDVSKPATKKILEDIERSRLMRNTLQKEFNQNISNWIKLLTEIIELNSQQIIISGNSNLLPQEKLGEFYLEYQEAQNNINNLLLGLNKNNNQSVSKLSKNKKNSEVFVQELISEVFRWALSIFKIYKHTQMMEKLASN